MLAFEFTCRWRFAEVILRRAEIKLKLSKTVMENGELASGLNTAIETKTQVSFVGVESEALSTDDRC